MNHLKAIHSKRRQVPSLTDEDAWRGFVELHTGQRSTKSLSNKQAMALINALNSMGAPDTRKPYSVPEGPYSKKITALWIACWNMGLVASPTDKALTSFARRQCQIDHIGWIRDARDAQAVIEALKSILERKGVDWSPTAKTDPFFMDTPGFRITAAQIALLTDMRCSLREHIRTQLQKTMSEMTSDDWIIVMNDLGRRIRAMGAAG